MAVAYWMFHAPTNFYPVLNGGDAAILYTFVFLLLVFTGPGAFSPDGLNKRGAVDRSERQPAAETRLSKPTRRALVYDILANP